MRIDKWSILDFIQYRRISRKRWQKSSKVGQKFITIGPIRKRVRQQLSSEEHMICEDEEKSGVLVHIYHLW